MQVIETMDPCLSAQGLANYPSLPGSTDPDKIEEIRRTVFITHISDNVIAENLMAFFSQVCLII